jgi:hypothetical protein
MIQVEIVGLVADKDACSAYHKVEYSCFDDNECGEVSFLSDTSIAHACYLTEHILRFDDNGAYAQLMRYICSTEFKDIEIGKVFSDLEESVEG